MTVSIGTANGLAQTNNKPLPEPKINQFPYVYAPQQLNPLRAKFFSGNINMYLHVMSFLHTDMP